MLFGRVKEVVVILKSRIFLAKICTDITKRSIHLPRKHLCTEEHYCSVDNTWFSSVQHKVGCHADKYRQFLRRFLRQSYANEMRDHEYDWFKMISIQVFHESSGVHELQICSRSRDVMVNKQTDFFGRGSEPAHSTAVSTVRDGTNFLFYYILEVMEKLRTVLKRYLKK